MKNRICFIITKSEVGGAQKWVKEQTDILIENGYKCYICTNQSDWLTQFSHAECFLDRRIEKRTSLGYLFALKKFLKNNEIRLVIGNSANGGIYSRLATAFSNRKCIYVSHGWSSVYNGGKLKFIFNLVERAFSFITNKILCVSSNDYKIAANIIGINKKKLIIIPNKILPIRTVSADSHKKPDSFRILFLGRLAPPKSPIPLIAAINGSPLFELDVVGDGPDFLRIKNHIKENEIQNVKLLGEIKNFNNFNTYNIFCLISKSEGLPLSAVEALSCGLPILISDVGGCAELIKENGYLTDDSPNDILKGLQLIIDNYSLYAQNSKKLFLDKYDLSVNYQEYIDLYENL